MVTSCLHVEVAQVPPRNTSYQGSLLSVLSTSLLYDQYTAITLNQTIPVTPNIPLLVSTLYGHHTIPTSSDHINCCHGVEASVDLCDFSS